MQKGQSIIEIIIALALFIIIASSSVVAIVSSLSTTRLAEEETQATLYATQGLEAVQSIRNQDWDNLSNGEHGLISSGSAWAFSGTSDTPDSSGKYTRVITIAEVLRDTAGTIASTSGATDSATKKVTATVTWDFTASRENTVSLVSYLTDWQFSRSSPGAGAPTLTTCNLYCENQGYTSGFCSPVTPPCTNSGGVYKPTGNAYCIGSPTDTCCCMP